jgi:hypothetical protein
MMMVMNSKLKLTCFVVFVLLFFNAVSSADLVFQMTADKYTLTSGEEATISIWAKIEEEVQPGYGLNAWQLDMVADTSGVVQADANLLIAPTPIDDGSGWLSSNVDSTGNVYGLGVFTSGGSKLSDTGIGGFSLLAQVTIEAIGTAGQQVTYELTDYTGTTGFWGALRNDTSGPSYVYPDNVQFLSGNNVFTIVPEPTSLLLMTLSAGLALRGRRIGSGK